MKNKKGFTLVELIAVIVILAIIIAIAVPTYGKIKTSVDKKNYENSISLAKTAALKYAEDTNIKIVFIQDLIEAGYLDEKQFENLVSPKTGNKISLNCYLLKVTSDKGMIYADFIDKEYKTEDKNQCDYNAKNKMNTDVKIIAKEYDNENEKAGQELQKSKNYWTNKDVQLTYSTSLQVESVEWYRGYEKLDEEIGQSIIISNQNLLEQLYTVKIVATKDGMATKYETSYYVRIDKNAPVIDKGVLTPPAGAWARTKVYEVTAHDNHSGLWGYAFIDKEALCTPDLDYQKNNKLSLNTPGTKKVCVKDYAGNVNTEAHIINVTDIDNTNMNCKFDILGTKLNSVDGVQWYKSAIVKLEATELGNSTITLGISESETPATYTNNITASTPFITQTKPANMSGRRFYGFIKNQAGTTGKCQSAKIGVETSIEAPVKTGERAGYDSITVNYTKGSAESGIVQTKCYRTDENGTIISGKEGTLSGNNCVFSVDPTEKATKYHFKKCIQSNARKNIEDEVCSDVAHISNVGYCDAGQYTTTQGTCNATCPSYCDYSGGSVSGTRTDTHTSKYKNKPCGTTSNVSCTKSCSKTVECCGTGNYTIDYGTCIATCPTTCGYAGGSVNGSRSYSTTSKYKNASGVQKSCGSGSTTCTKTCVATAACWTYQMTFTQYVDAIGNGANRCFPCSSGGCDSECLNDHYDKITNYKSISYEFKVNNNSSYQGTCELNIIGKDGGLYGLYSFGFGTSSTTITQSGTVSEVKNGFGQKYSTISGFGQSGKISVKCFSQHTSTPAGGFDVTVSVRLNK